MIMLLAALLGIAGIIVMIGCIVAVVLKHIAETHFAAHGQENLESQDKDPGR